MHVLIVNAIMMGDNNATGVTMKNMLYGIESIDYLQLCVDYRVNAHEQLVETMFINLDNAPADKFVWMLKGKPDFKHKDENAKNERLVSAANEKGKLGEALKGIVDSISVTISSEQYAKIIKFEPDVIYTMGASMHVMQLAIDLSQKLGIPIIFHCMDDWRSTIYTKSILSKPFHRKILALLNKINSRSCVNLAICEKMAEHYSAEYGKKYNYASNCVFEYNKIPYKVTDSSKMLIIFSGGLHFGRGERLREVAKIVDEMNLEKYKVELEIFAPDSQVQIFSNKFGVFKHTKLLPYVEQKMQMSNLCRADVLLHVESSNPMEVEYMQYSFSTKLVEYFAAGRTVLGFGSTKLSSIEYIDKKQCGLIAKNEDELKTKLVTLYNEPDLRERFSKTCLDVAINFHSQEAVQKKVLETFLSVKKEISGGRS